MGSILSLEVFKKPSEATVCGSVVLPGAYMLFVVQVWVHH